MVLFPGIEQWCYSWFGQRYWANLVKISISKISAPIPCSWVQFSLKNLGFSQAFVYSLRHLQQYFYGIIFSKNDHDDPFIQS